MSRRGTASRPQARRGPRPCGSRRHRHLGRSMPHQVGADPKRAETFQRGGQYLPQQQNRQQQRRECLPLAGRRQLQQKAPLRASQKEPRGCRRPRQGGPEKSTQMGRERQQKDLQRPHQRQRHQRPQDARIGAAEPEGAWGVRTAGGGGFRPRQVGGPIPRWMCHVAPGETRTNPPRLSLVPGPQLREGRAREGGGGDREPDITGRRGAAGCPFAGAISVRSSDLNSRMLGTGSSASWSQVSRRAIQA